MADPLAIHDLLNILDIEQHTDVRRNVLELCHKVENLLRRRHAQEALIAAKNAAYLAHKAFDYQLQGVALLYSSHARISSHLPGEDQFATNDCERAIRLFCLELHNCTIARVIRAQIEFQINQDNDQQTALAYFIKASEELQKLATQTTERNDLKYAEAYATLNYALATQIARITDLLTKVRTPLYESDVQLAELSKPTTTSLVTQFFQNAQLPIKINVPALSLPILDSARLGFSPKIGDIKLDSMGASQISIDGCTYQLKPIIPTMKGSFHPKASETYYRLPLAASTDQWVLIRQQDRPDQDRQFIVVTDTVSRQTWLDECESSAHFTHVRTLGGDREWTVNDNLQIDATSPHSYRIIGIVEALLIPC